MASSAGSGHNPWLQPRSLLHRSLDVLQQHGFTAGECISVLHKIRGCDHDLFQQILRDLQFQPTFSFSQSTLVPTESSTNPQDSVSTIQSENHSVPYAVHSRDALQPAHDGRYIEHRPGDPHAQRCTYPTVILHGKEKWCCVTCKILLQDKRNLAKHEREKCEWVADYYCSLDSCQEVYTTPSRLKEHHKSPRHNCSICKASDEHVEDGRFELPTKKLWGCPCCVRSFEDRAGYKQHVAIHLHDDPHLQRWSVETRLQSLLRQESMAQALEQYPSWESWRFSNLSPKESSFIDLWTGLERRSIPKRFPLEYQSMHFASALALFAFRSSDENPSPGPHSAVGEEYVGFADKFDVQMGGSS